MAENSTNTNEPATENSSPSIDLGAPNESATTESGTKFDVEELIEQGTAYAGVDTISNRDVAIAGVALVAAMAAFFMLKRVFELWCVNRRVAPTKAKLAGTLLFVGLTLLSVAVALYILSPVKFGVILFMGPLITVSSIALVLAGLNARK